MRHSRVRVYSIFSANPYRTVQVFRLLFGWGPQAYYEYLNHLMDRPEALEADPMLVKRLRRMRSTRVANR